MLDSLYPNLPLSYNIVLSICDALYFQFPVIQFNLYPSTLRMLCSQESLLRTKRLQLLYGSGYKESSRYCNKEPEDDSTKIQQDTSLPHRYEPSKLKLHVDDASLRPFQIIQYITWVCEDARIVNITPREWSLAKEKLKIIRHCNRKVNMGYLDRTIKVSAKAVTTA